MCTSIPPSLHPHAQVDAVVNSYALSKLTTQYHDGTRLWMYETVDTWLKAGESRLMLILAGPGMGKSVFSAVMVQKLHVLLNSQRDLVLVQHFFKVGEPRSQGRAMLLCLAQQLAEKLPGFAHVLAPVVEEHADGKDLPNIREAFEM